MNIFISQKLDEIKSLNELAILYSDKAKFNYALEYLQPGKPETLAKLQEKLKKSLLQNEVDKFMTTLQNSREKCVETLIQKMKQDSTGKHLKTNRQVHVQSQTIKRWKRKEICLNINLRQLAQKSEKKISFVDLSSYVLQPSIRKENKYSCLFLKSDAKNNKYKQLLIGFDNDVEANEYKGYFEQAINNVQGSDRLGNVLIQEKEDLILVDSGQIKVKNVNSSSDDQSDYKSVNSRNTLQDAHVKGHTLDNIEKFNLIKTQDLKQKQEFVILDSQSPIHKDLATQSAIFSNKQEALVSDSEKKIQIQRINTISGQKPAQTEYSKAERQNTNSSKNLEFGTQNSAPPKKVKDSPKNKSSQEQQIPIQTSSKPQNPTEQQQQPLVSPQPKQREEISQKIVIQEQKAIINVTFNQTLVQPPQKEQIVSTKAKMVPKQPTPAVQSLQPAQPIQQVQQIQSSQPQPSQEKTEQVSSQTKLITQTNKPQVSQSNHDQSLQHQKEILITQQPQSSQKKQNTIVVRQEDQRILNINATLQQSSQSWRNQHEKLPPGNNQQTVPENKVLKTPQKKIVNQPHQEVVYKTPQQQSPQQAQHFEQAQEKHVQVSKSSKHPKLFQEIIENTEMKNLISEDNFTVKYNHENTRILQHNENSLRMKLIQTVELEHFSTFYILSNSQQLKKWHPIVEESQIVNFMSREDTAVIYEKHRSFGTFYRPRDFVFLRYAFYQDETFFMIDKSIDYDTLEPGTKTVRGIIYLGFTVLMRNKQNPHLSLLIIDRHMSNRGFNNQDQDSSITQRYLQQYGCLGNFIKQRLFYTSDFRSYKVFELGYEELLEHQQKLKEEQNRFLTSSEDQKQSLNSTDQRMHQVTALRDKISSDIVADVDLSGQERIVTVKSKYQGDAQLETSQNHEEYEKINEIENTQGLEEKTVQGIVEDVFKDAREESKKEPELFKPKEELQQDFEERDYLQEQDSDTLGNVRFTQESALQEPEQKEQELNNQEIQNINEQEQQLSTNQEGEITYEDDDQFEEAVWEESRKMSVIMNQSELFMNHEFSLDFDEQKELLEQVVNNKHWHYILKRTTPFLLRADPKYQPQRMQQYDSSGSDYILQGNWRREEKNGHLVFTNKKLIEKQKYAVAFLLKKIGSNIIRGKSILGVSLPVNVFEKRSNMERIAYSMALAPDFLEKAALSNDPVVQLKYSITFLLTTSLLYLNLEKPFNPILGETFQAFIGGCPIYCEQVSHHPPISSFTLYGQNYTMNGSLESIASLHANSVTGQNAGNIFINFHKTQNTIVLRPPSGVLYGTAFGERYFNLEGIMCAYDITNNIYCEGQFDLEKKSPFYKKGQPIDYFGGGIFKMVDTFKEKFNKKKIGFSGMNFKEDCVQECLRFDGNWYQEIRFGNEVTWNLKDGPIAYQLIYEKQPLASDCRFREDSITWKMEDAVKAQELKEKLENIQRNDKKLRQKFGPKKKH